MKKTYLKVEMLIATEKDADYLVNEVLPKLMKDYEIIKSMSYFNVVSRVKE